MEIKKAEFKKMFNNSDLRIAKINDYLTNMYMIINLKDVKIKDVVIDTTENILLSSGLKGKIREYEEIYFKKIFPVKENLKPFKLTNIIINIYENEILVFVSEDGEIIGIDRKYSPLLEPNCIMYGKDSNTPIVNDIENISFLIMPTIENTVKNAILPQLDAKKLANFYWNNECE